MSLRAAGSRRWAAVQVLMALVALAHLLQPLLLPWRPKFYVASAGAVLYTVCFLGLLGRRRWSLYIAAVGPLVGFGTLCVGALLAALGLVQIQLRPDVYTLLGGLLQVPALILALGLLKEPAAPGDSADRRPSP